MSKWQECKLGDVVITNSKSIDRNYSFETILYLDTGSITEGKIESFQEISLKDAPSRAKRLAKPNDIVYSTVRPIQRHYGILKSPQPNLVVSTGFTVIEANQNFAHPEFIYYLLSSDESVEYLDVIAEASTSTYPSLKPSDIENLDISLPPLEEQKAIASVLSSLDDKIDLLHRQNTTLERMAETLFRQWFVEEAQVDWEEYKVSDFAEHLKHGVNPAQNPFIEYHHYSLPAFDESRRPVIELGSQILSNKYSVLENTILVSKLNPRFPRIWAIQSLPSANSVCSTEFQVFKPKQDNLYAYLYFLFGSSQAKDALEMAASGTSGSHQRVKPEDMLNIITQLPSIGRAIEFSEITQPYIDKITANRKQIQTLEKIRDNLLPKLMSGEVPVDLERLST